MEYTTRMGSGPGRAHVNYQCPCGCVGGVIYRSDRPLSKAGACCCGRKLWVGDGGEALLRPYLDVGVDYEWDFGSVTLPWGEVAQTAMAWPGNRELRRNHGDDEARRESTAPELVRDVVCGMMIEAAAAAGVSAYRGKTYYFCAQACKQRFDVDPRPFVQLPGTLDRLRRR